MKSVVRTIRSEFNHYPLYRATSNLFQNIHIWVGIIFITGLFSITEPPLDDHTWRQTLTIMIAKNFYEISPNILYPRMDIGGSGDGIMAVEFPVYNYILAGLYSLFGYQHWYGRLVNWVLACTAALFFYRIAYLLLNSRSAALFASMALLVSIFMEYGRKTMPDSFSLSLVIIGVYWGWQFLGKQKHWMLFGSVLLFALGIMSKIPALCFATVLLVPMLNSKYPLAAKVKLASGYALACTAMLWWYFAWMPYLLQTYHNQLIWPVGITEGIAVFRANLHLVYERFHSVFYVQYLFFASMAGGLWLLIVKRSAFRLMMLAYLLIFIFYALKTGIVFPTHSYYVIPVIPFMAIGLGFMASKLPFNALLKTLIMAVLFIPAWLQLQQKAEPLPDTAYLLTLRDIAEQHIPPGTKIMVNSGQHDPTLMFFAGRRGWTVNNDVLHLYSWMPDFKRDGLSHIIVDRHRYNRPLHYEIVFENDDFIIYSP